VVLERNGVPLAGATLEVIAGSRGRGAGAYTLDAQGTWHMGWHLFHRPEFLYISIADKNGERFKKFLLFRFPKQNDWTVNFCGPAAVRTRTRTWNLGFWTSSSTETSSETELAPPDNPAGRK
jgi:hypothetical protein